MDDVKSFCILCLFVLLTILCRQGAALMCWQCGPCSDPFDKTNVNYTKVTCNGTCLKTVTEFHDLGLYNYRLECPSGFNRFVCRGCKGQCSSVYYFDVSRRCSVTFQTDQCIDRRGKNEVCTCGKDLCNGSRNSRVISIATVITSLAAILDSLFV